MRGPVAGAGTVAVAHVPVTHFGEWSFGASLSSGCHRRGTIVVVNIAAVDVVGIVVGVVGAISDGIGDGDVGAIGAIHVVGFVGVIGVAGIGVGGAGVLVVVVGGDVIQGGVFI